MKPSEYLPGPLALLSALALASAAIAQNSSPSSQQQSSASPTPAASSTTPKDQSSNPPSSSVVASISNTGSVVSSAPSAPAGAPTITGGPQATSGLQLTGFPTLTGPGVIPSYPPASVPPTNNAPFMQQSNLPDGTVFIAVGSILGALGLAVLLWRSIVSLMLHRSVARAAMAQHSSDNKTSFPAPPAPFYKYTDRASPSPAGAAAAGGGGGGVGGVGGAGGAASSAAPAGRGVRRTQRGPTPSAAPSHSNLFFSPTAGAGASSNRGSSYLPSGFYAAGNSSPGGGGHNLANSISLSNLRPDSRGHYANVSRNTMDITPPESPQGGARRDLSSSSLNVNLIPGQRAPSAYLDDLLMDDPSAFPPPQMPPSSGSRRTGSPDNRF
ncbi:uncharacterized protein UV8b_02781 [Ustilaginoidea virens]|uniref:Uncharacterized protein n=1 Tax=Ustilaginoidea virens TaxID=1159556 RepID=A0A8E5HNK3_USTVR|nr:uncharacterized protein UV8b_02781 [Ustilaginoidea virens]QUC18540.1 hypothetical protein UV8b_02781 [Ustilaginoidea virens]